MKTRNLILAVALVAVGVPAEEKGPADYYDPELTQPIPDGVEALGTRVHLVVSSGSPATVDPDAKSTYIQEGVVGFEFEALPQLTLGIQYLYRDMPRVLAPIAWFRSELQLFGARRPSRASRCPAPAQRQTPYAETRAPRAHAAENHRYAAARQIKIRCG